MITGYRRIKKERLQFGTKINDLFAEGRHTFKISLIFSVIISALAVFFGIVLSFETILVLIVVMMVLSITGRTNLLSASYTIGFTFILLILLPFVQLEQLSDFVSFQNITAVHLICLAILTGLLLLVEAMLIGSAKHRQTFPHMEISQ